MRSGCWLWTGAIDRGYGVFTISGHNVRAHRFAYELLVGPIPDGLVPDHLCRNRACVNHDHIEPVTEQVNILRGDGMAAMRAVRTQCPEGHEYAGDNLYINRGMRYCRACRVVKQRARRELAKSVGG